MKKSLRDSWVAALRSGKYKQGITALKRNDCFCCIGVLCDVVDNTKWEKLGINLDAYKHDGKITYDIDYLRKDQINELVMMNDSYGNNFNEIDDWVEKNIPADDDEAVSANEAETLVGYVVQCNVTKKYVGKKRGWGRRFGELSSADIWERKADATSCINANRFQRCSVVKLTLSVVSKEVV